MLVRMKLLALVGICLALVATTACKKKKKPDPQKACTQVERVCKDGSKGVADGTGADACYKKCPEDEHWNTATVTTTDTATVSIPATGN